MFLAQEVENEFIFAFFVRYRSILKNAIIGQESLQLAKVAEVVHIILSFYPSQRVTIELIFPLQAAVSMIRDDFKITVFGHEIWPLAKL